MKRKIYYVFNGRFPSEKAHALYVAKHTQALCALGFDVTIVAPRRLGRVQKKYSDFFSIPECMSVVYIPTIDLSIVRMPRIINFWCNSLFFTIGVFIFFLLKNKNEITVFAHDTGTAIILCLLREHIVYEMHDYPEKKKRLFAFIARRVGHIVTQNNIKKDRLIREFGLSETMIFVEPNGVDLEKFSTPYMMEEARRKLHIPQDLFVVLYTGHLFDWKGAQILAQAASFLDGSYHVYFVGGSPNDVRTFENVFSNVHNISVVGYKPYSEIPLWQKAAHCLVVPNTATKDISKFYTAPMKLFEYMASQRAVIASDLPSLRQLVTEDEVVFAMPDNPKALAQTIMKVKNNYTEYNHMVAKAFASAQEHSWEKRAIRIAQACGL